MASIDFEAIENQKENIQAIPGGRSAKQLASLCSPLLETGGDGLVYSQEQKRHIQQEFEKELQSVDDADDPLEMYDRMVKWTLNAYPAAQATPASGLVELIERATSKFVDNDMYRNDPRYLKLWFMHIKLFNESPSEIYAFLVSHGIGRELALFYEEYAAWSERNGQWAQASEIFNAGIRNAARPKERLARKYAEFQLRRQSQSDQADDRPDCLAAHVRPALMSRLTGPSEPAGGANAQSGSQPAADMPVSTAGSRRGKMTVFSDSDDSASVATLEQAGHPARWDGMASLGERRKENTRQPASWTGQTLNGGKKLGAPKMIIFKDPFLNPVDNENILPIALQAESVRPTVDANGKLQHVFAHLEAIYPDGVGGTLDEYCFEELRARRRGLLHLNWLQQDSRAALSRATDDRFDLPLLAREAPAQKRYLATASTHEQHSPVFIPLKLDEVPLADQKLKGEEKANRTRKIKIMKVEMNQETQTIQTNFNSPTEASRPKRKKREATMTIHTKEAMNEVYDIFNQSLDRECNDHLEAAGSEQNTIDDQDEGDYTSAGESTFTGHLSGGLSEYGDETNAEFTIASQLNEDMDSTTQQIDDKSDCSETTRTDVVEEEEEEDCEDSQGSHRGTDYDDEDLSEVHVSTGGIIVSTELEAQPDYERVYQTTTPSSLLAEHCDNYMEHQSINQTVDSFVLPERTGKVSSKMAFMTPIVEKTECSVSELLTSMEENLIDLKTPSRRIGLDKVPGMYDNKEMSLVLESNEEEEEEEEEEKEVDTNASNLPKPSQGGDGLSEALTVSSTSMGQVSPDIGRSSATGSPIIPDPKCNPIDPAIRQHILDSLNPPIAAYPGFTHLAGASNSLGAELRKHAKTVSKRSAGGETLPQGLRIDFVGSDRIYTARRELGCGAFAPVYLVDSRPRREDGSCQMPRRSTSEVIKVEKPSSAWEFYIIRQVKLRLGSYRAAASVVDAHELHMYDEESFLVEDYRSLGTLLDAVNLLRGENGIMEEQLALFFGIELLRTIECLHKQGVIHGDVKPDNVLLRLDQASETWSSAYKRNGGEGWSDKGILLIDFGRGIDMLAFSKEVQFIADWQTTEWDCIEMREMRPWTYQVDYYGIAGILHSFLFGKYMAVTADDGAGLDSCGPTKRYRIRESLKRYWQTDIWSLCFDMLLNPLVHTRDEAAQQLPLPHGLARLRGMMELSLESNSEKGLGLKALLRRLEASAKEKKR